jgi:hypothetical protein
MRFSTSISNKTEMLSFKKFTNYFHSVYIHTRENWMWPSTGVPPMPMPILQLGIHNQTDVISIEAKISEKDTTLMDKPSAHCKAYKDEKDGFNNCTRNFFFTFLKDKVKCTMPGNSSTVGTTLWDHFGPYHN